MAIAQNNTYHYHYNDDPQLLVFRCELEALITQREGMIAVNQQRERHGEAPAYNDEGFAGVACDICELCKRIEAYVKLRKEASNA